MTSRPTSLCWRTTWRILSWSTWQSWRRRPLLRRRLPQKPQLLLLPGAKTKLHRRPRANGRKAKQHLAPRVADSPEELGQPRFRDPLSGRPRGPEGSGVVQARRLEVEHPPAAGGEVAVGGGRREKRRRRRGRRRKGETGPGRRSRLRRRKMCVRRRSRSLEARLRRRTRPRRRRRRRSVKRRRASAMAGDAADDAPAHRQSPTMTTQTTRITATASQGRPAPGHEEAESAGVAVDRGGNRAGAMTPTRPHLGATWMGPEGRWRVREAEVTSPPLDLEAHQETAPLPTTGSLICSSTVRRHA
mmetsp:Transcript_28615/g.62439  ORF Transcript_28615/g.62439 Transcript_28615/m.62439 type:complete len:302 (-) Transcript_28615:287-1192(-)